MGSVLNDAPCIVTGCLRLTPMEYLPVLSDIQPAELRRKGARFYIAYRGCLNGQLHGSQNESKETLKSRRYFQSAARKLSGSLSEIGIRAAQ